MQIKTSFFILSWRNIFLTWAAYGMLALCVISIAGCKQEGVPVTGKDAGSSDGQSETALTTSFANGQSIAVVTYNDETDHAQTILYGPNSRKILPGASQMGWSYSSNSGQSWTYGGKVKPPNGWAVLWGDPAITTSNAHYRYVFISNLAIPNSKMPPGGIDGSVVISGADSYIGGACIARSSDGGITFQAYQCVSNMNKNGVPNSEKGHFYDGGSMASSDAGEIYAAFVDYTTNQIDVWRSSNENGQFAQMPTPFPGITIQNHPRLRVNRPDGALYVVAQAANGVIFINRFRGGQWGAPVVASDPGVINPDVTFGSGLKLRTGPQYSFAIGASSDDNESDAIRLLYTRRDDKSGRLYVTGSYILSALTLAKLPPSTGMGHDAWQPQHSRRSIQSKCRGLARIIHYTPGMERYLSGPEWKRYFSHAATRQPRLLAKRHTHLRSLCCHQSATHLPRHARLLGRLW